MIFSQGSGIITNAATNKQWQEVQNERNAANFQANQHLKAGYSNNASGLVPRDAYVEFDNETTRIMRGDNGDTFLNDLMPLSRSINIGKLVLKHRTAGDMGNVQSSMTGQIGVKRDQTEYGYGSAIVPIHDVGFGRQWRERAALESEGFNALADDQAGAVEAMREHLSDSFINGMRNNDGSYITIDGESYKGAKNDARFAQVDLGAAGLNFDFTDTTKTGQEVLDAFTNLKNILRITNNVATEVTYYISRELEANFERPFSAQYNSGSILASLKLLAGVADIKSTNKLNDNEIMGFPLKSNIIRPIVGMGVNTVAMPRPVYNSNYDFVVWSAIGFEIKADANGNQSAMFAKG